MIILWCACMALLLCFIFGYKDPGEASKKAAKAQHDSSLRYIKFLGETTQTEKEIALQELAYADLTDDEIFFLATRETN